MLASSVPGSGMVDISYAVLIFPLCRSVLLGPPCLKVAESRSNGVQNELTGTMLWIDMEIKHEDRKSKLLSIPNNFVLYPFF